MLKITEKPRIVLMISNLVGEEVAMFLYERNESPVAIFLAEENKYGVSFEAIEEYKPDLIITCYWPYLLKPEIINLPKYGCINFHPSLLPKHRGWYPAVWQVLEGGKAGVTLHLIDEGADTGPIIAQREYDVLETDTGGSVYEKSQRAMIDLFKETWVKIRNIGVELKEQDHSKASYRTKKDANDCDEIGIDEIYNAGYLIDLLKAKTFGNKGFAYYQKNGKKYYVTIQVTESNE